MTHIRDQHISNHEIVVSVTLPDTLSRRQTQRESQRRMLTLVFLPPMLQLAHVLLDGDLVA